MSLVLSLVWTSCDFAQAAADLPTVFVSPSNLPQFRLIPPASLGRVVDYFNAGSDHRLVILIQDLHTHYGVQKNIAGLLDFLSKKVPKNRLESEATPKAPPFALAVEGGSGPVDSSVLALLPDARLKEETSQFLMHEGELTGAEYFAAKRGLPKFLTGVENPQYYQTHRDLFRKTFDDRKKLVRALKSIQNDVNVLPRRTYHGDLKELQSRINDFEAGRLSSLEFIEDLVNRANRLGLDIKTTYPDLVQFTAKGLAISSQSNPTVIQRSTTELMNQIQGQLSAEEKKNLQVLDRQSHEGPYYLYLRDLVYQHHLFMAVPTELAHYLEYVYTLRLSGMNRVLHQAQELAFQLKSRLATTQPEKDLVQVQHDLDLLLRVADLQATEPEVHDFAPRLPQFMALTRALIARTGTDSTNEASSLSADALRRLISSSIDYYVMAMLRNAPMVDNTLALLKTQAPSVAVLVAGGFHTTPISKLLREHHISYLVIAPHVDHITDADHALYEKRLNGDLLTDEEIVTDAPKMAHEWTSQEPTFKTITSNLATGFPSSGKIGAGVVLTAAIVLGAASHGVPLSAYASHFQHLIAPLQNLPGVSDWSQRLSELLDLRPTVVQSSLASNWNHLLSSFVRSGAALYYVGHVATKFFMSRPSPNRWSLRLRYKLEEFGYRDTALDDPTLGAYLYNLFALEKTQKDALPSTLTKAARVTLIVANVVQLSSVFSDHVATLVSSNIQFLTSVAQRVPHLFIPLVGSSEPLIVHISFALSIMGGIAVATVALYDRARKHPAKVGAPAFSLHSGGGNISAGLDDKEKKRLLSKAVEIRYEDRFKADTLEALAIKLDLNFSGHTEDLRALSYAIIKIIRARDGFKTPFLVNGKPLRTNLTIADIMVEAVRHLVETPLKSIPLVSDALAVQDTERYLLGEGTSESNALLESFFDEESPLRKHLAQALFHESLEAVTPQSEAVHQALIQQVQTHFFDTEKFKKDIRNFINETVLKQRGQASIRQRAIDLSNGTDPLAIQNYLDENQSDLSEIEQWYLAKALGGLLLIQRNAPLARTNGVAFEPVTIDWSSVERRQALRISPELGKSKLNDRAHALKTTLGIDLYYFPELLETVEANAAYDPETNSIAVSEKAFTSGQVTELEEHEIDHSLTHLYPWNGFAGSAHVQGATELSNAVEDERELGYYTQSMSFDELWTFAREAVLHINLAANSDHDREFHLSEFFRAARIGVGLSQQTQGLTNRFSEIVRSGDTDHLTMSYKASVKTLRVNQLEQRVPLLTVTIVHGGIRLVLPIPDMLPTAEKPAILQAVLGRLQILNDAAVQLESQFREINNDSNRLSRRDFRNREAKTMVTTELERMANRTVRLGATVFQIYTNKTPDDDKRLMPALPLGSARLGSTLWLTDHRPFLNTRDPNPGASGEQYRGRPSDLPPSTIEVGSALDRLAKAVLSPGGYIFYTSYIGPLWETAVVRALAMSIGPVGGALVFAAAHFIVEWLSRTVGRVKELGWRSALQWPSIKADMVSHKKDDLSRLRSHLIQGFLFSLPFALFSQIGLDHTLAIALPFAISFVMHMLNNILVLNGVLPPFINTAMALLLTAGVAQGSVRDARSLQEPATVVAQSQDQSAASPTTAYDKTRLEVSVQDLREEISQLRDLEKYASIAYPGKVTPLDASTEAAVRQALVEVEENLKKDQISLAKEQLRNAYETAMLGDHRDAIFANVSEAQIQEALTYFGGKTMATLSRDNLSLWVAEKLKKLGKKINSKEKENLDRNEATLRLALARQVKTVGAVILPTMGTANDRTNREGSSPSIVIVLIQAINGFWQKFLDLIVPRRAQRRRARNAVLKGGLAIASVQDLAPQGALESDPSVSRLKEAAPFYEKFCSQA